MANKGTDLTQISLTPLLSRAYEINQWQVGAKVSQILLFLELLQSSGNVSQEFYIQ